KLGVNQTPMPCSSRTDKISTVRIVPWPGRAALDRSTLRFGRRGGIGRIPTSSSEGGARELSAAEVVPAASSALSSRDVSTDAGRSPVLAGPERSSPSGCPFGLGLNDFRRMSITSAYTWKTVKQVRTWPCQAKLHRDGGKGTVGTRWWCW